SVDLGRDPCRTGWTLARAGAGATPSASAPPPGRGRGNPGRGRLGYCSRARAHTRAGAVRISKDRGIERLQIRIQIQIDRKSTRLNSSHVKISYAVFCLKKKT